MVTGLNKIITGDQWGRSKLFGRQGLPLVLCEIIEAQIAMASKTIEAVQFQVFLELGLAKEPLQGVTPHAHPSVTSEIRRVVVLAPGAAEHVGHLTDGDPALDRVDHERHKVLVAAGRPSPVRDKLHRLPGGEAGFVGSLAGVTTTCTPRGPA